MANVRHFWAGDRFHRPPPLEAHPPRQHRSRMNEQEILRIVDKAVDTFDGNLDDLESAIGMLMLWSALFGQVTLATLWLGHTVVALPYVVRTTLAVLSESDPFLEEAARTMGANRLQRLLFVVLPQCFPGLAAGAFFAFNMSFDEAVLSLFLRKPDLTTLPVQIYGQLEFSPDPSVAAVSTLMIGKSSMMDWEIRRRSNGSRCPGGNGRPAR